MKIIYTIIVVLVWFAIIAALIDIPGNRYHSGSAQFLSVAGMIGASYGGYKLIRYIFKKQQHND